MDGLQRQLKCPDWRAELSHLRVAHTASGPAAALPRFTGAAATANAVAADGCRRTVPSRSRLMTASSQEPSRLETSVFCDHTHPTRILPQPQQLQSGILRPTVAYQSHGSQLFPSLSRSCSSPEVNVRGQSGALCSAGERGSLPPIAQSKVNIFPGNLNSSFFVSQAAPVPLFDSRAAAATAASCCTHAATADVASPRRWAGKVIVSSSCRASARTENTPSFQRLQGKPQQKSKIRSLNARQTDANSTGEYEAATEATQESELFQQKKAVGCTASPRAIEAYAKSPRSCSPSGSPRSLSGHRRSRDAATKRESSVDCSNSSTSDTKTGKTHRIQPTEQDTIETPGKQDTPRVTSTTMVKLNGRREESCLPFIILPGGLHASTQRQEARLDPTLHFFSVAEAPAVDNNLERFEGMLEPIVKLLVAKSVEQAVEERRQEQQLLTLQKRKQQLLQSQQQQLLELEQREERRHLQAQQALQNQLVVKEQETQLWRHLWVAHIGTTLLDEDSFEKVVDQLEEESLFLSSADTVPGEFLAEVAKAASAELKKRKDIGEELVKCWFHAEKVHTANRRQQELLLWGQHLKMREKIKRRREQRRGIAHIFVTPAELNRAAKYGSSGKGRKTNILKRDFLEPSNSFEALGPDPYSLQESMSFEDITEMHRKAQATVEAAADLVSLSLPNSSSAEDGRSRQLVLKAETARLTEAFEERQRQLLPSRKYKIASEREKTAPDDADGQDNISNSSCPPGTSAAIFIGPFKLLRKKDSVTCEKKFISMERLQQEVQKRMCDCFSDMAAIIRSSQIIFEAKGAKISEVEDLLKYEYGDLRVRLDRKITFASPTEESGSELESEESRDMD